eukprot:gene32151-16682_t
MPNAASASKSVQLAASTQQRQDLKTQLHIAVGHSKPEISTRVSGGSARSSLPGQNSRGDSGRSDFPSNKEDSVSDSAGINPTRSESTQNASHRRTPSPHAARRVSGSKFMGSGSRVTPSRHPPGYNRPVTFVHTWKLGAGAVADLSRAAPSLKPQNTPPAIHVGTPSRDAQQTGEIQALQSTRPNPAFPRPSKTSGQLREIKIFELGLSPGQDSDEGRTAAPSSTPERDGVIPSKPEVSNRSAPVPGQHETPPSSPGIREAIKTSAWEEQQPLHPDGLVLPCSKSSTADELNPLALLKTPKLSSATHNPEQPLRPTTFTQVACEDSSISPQLEAVGAGKELGSKVSAHINQKCSDQAGEDTDGKQLQAQKPALLSWLHGQEDQYPEPLDAICCREAPRDFTSQGNANEEYPGEKAKSTQGLPTQPVEHPSCLKQIDSTEGSPFTKASIWKLPPSKGLTVPIKDQRDVQTIPATKFSSNPESAHELTPESRMTVSKTDFTIAHEKLQSQHQTILVLPQVNVMAKGIHRTIPAPEEVPAEVRQPANALTDIQCAHPSPQALEANAWAPAFLHGNMQVVPSEGMETGGSPRDAPGEQCNASGPQSEGMETGSNPRDEPVELCDANSHQSEGMETGSSPRDVPVELCDANGHQKWTLLAKNTPSPVRVVPRELPSNLRQEQTTDCESKNEQVECIAEDQPGRCKTMEIQPLANDEVLQLKHTVDAPRGALHELSDPCLPLVMESIADIASDRAMTDNQLLVSDQGHLLQRTIGEPRRALHEPSDTCMPLVLESDADNAGDEAMSDNQLLISDLWTVLAKSTPSHVLVVPRELPSNLRQKQSTDCAAKNEQAECIAEDQPRRCKTMEIQPLANDEGHQIKHTMDAPGGALHEPSDPCLPLVMESNTDGAGDISMTDIQLQIRDQVRLHQHTVDVSRGALHQPSHPCKPVVLEYNPDDEVDNAVDNAINELVRFAVECVSNKEAVRYPELHSSRKAAQTTSSAGSQHQGFPINLSCAPRIALAVDVKQGHEPLVRVSIAQVSAAAEQADTQAAQQADTQDTQAAQQADTQDTQAAQQADTQDTQAAQQADTQATQAAQQADTQDTQTPLDQSVYPLNTCNSFDKAYPQSASQQADTQAPLDQGVGPLNTCNSFDKAHPPSAAQQADTQAPLDQSVCPLNTCNSLVKAYPPSAAQQADTEAPLDQGLFALNTCNSLIKAYPPSASTKSQKTPLSKADVPKYAKRPLLIPGSADSSVYTKHPSAATRAKRASWKSRDSKLPSSYAAAGHLPGESKGGGNAEAQVNLIPAKPKRDSHSKDIGADHTACRPAPPPVQNGSPCCQKVPAASHHASLANNPPACMSFKRRMPKSLLGHLCSTAKVQARGAGTGVSSGSQAVGNRTTNRGQLSPTHPNLSQHCAAQAGLPDKAPKLPSGPKAPSDTKTRLTSLAALPTSDPKEMIPGRATSLRPQAGLPDKAPKVPSGPKAPSDTKTRLTSLAALPTSDPKEVIPGRATNLRPQAGLPDKAPKVPSGPKAPSDTKTSLMSPAALPTSGPKEVIPGRATSLRPQAGLSDKAPKVPSDTKAPGAPKTRLTSLAAPKLPANPKAPSAPKTSMVSPAALPPSDPKEMFPGRAVSPRSQAASIKKGLLACLSKQSKVQARNMEGHKIKYCHSQKQEQQKQQQQQEKMRACVKESRGRESQEDKHKQEASSSHKKTSGPPPPDSEAPKHQASESELGLKICPKDMSAADFIADTEMNIHSNGNPQWFCMTAHQALQLVVYHNVELFIPDGAVFKGFKQENDK